MDKKSKYIIEECRSCGNKTKLDIVAEHLETNEVTYYNMSYNIEMDDWISDINWMILKCCVCNNMSIATNYTDENSIKVEESYITIVYPEKTYSSYHMPEEIYKAYEVALKARYLDSSLCMLSLRRTLEIICKQQGEQSGKLQKKIERLAKRGVLPSVLKEASHIVRNLGNAAAHGDSVEFKEKEVKETIKFVDLIIDYIYILPEKIKQLEKWN